MINIQLNLCLSAATVTDKQVVVGTFCIITRDYKRKIIDLEEAQVKKILRIFMKDITVSLKEDLVKKFPESIK